MDYDRLKNPKTGDIVLLKDSECCFSSEYGYNHEGLGTITEPLVKGRGFQIAMNNYPKEEYWRCNKCIVLDTPKNRKLYKEELLERLLSGDKRYASKME